MTRYFVRTVQVEPTVTLDEMELMENLPFDNDMIENRFPFDGLDLERNKLEVYKIGSKVECEEYIKSTDQKIRDLFKVEIFD